MKYNEKKFGEAVQYKHFRTKTLLDKREYFIKIFCNGLIYWVCKIIVNIYVSSNSTKC